jgi:hypothetical protein
VRAWPHRLRRWGSPAPAPPRQQRERLSTRMRSLSSKSAAYLCVCARARARARACVFFFFFVACVCVCAHARAGQNRGDGCHASTAQHGRQRLRVSMASSRCGAYACMRARVCGQSVEQHVVGPLRRVCVHACTCVWAGSRAACRRAAALVHQHAAYECTSVAWRRAAAARMRACVRACVCVAEPLRRARMCVQRRAAAAGVADGTRHESTRRHRSPLKDSNSCVRACVHTRARARVCV